VSGLTLLHPWLLVGLLGASLPILIHLIGRRRAPTVPFAAFDFLLAVNKRLARRERLRQILLLILRTLALVALALGVARPMTARPAAAALANRRLAIVIDTSASMRYDIGGVTLFERAKSKARDLLSRLQPGDVVTLVAAGQETRPVLQAPTPDLGRARAALDALAPPAGIADMGAAIELALSQFGAQASGVTLAIISDLADNGFRTLRPTSLDPPPDVRLIDAAERDEVAALGNLAIEGVTIEAGGGSAAERRFKVVVRNFGATPVAGRTVELVLNGAVTQRGTIDVAGRAAQEKVYTHEFASPGVYQGEVRLASASGDGYTADDRAFFTLEVVPGVRLLAVDGDVRATPYEDELYFAERALQTVPKGDATIVLRVASPDEFAEPALELRGFDAVLLANVGTLADAAIAKLAEFVRSGGGLLITLGDKVRFEQANVTFAKLLPAALRDLHLTADPGAGSPPLGITGIDWDHPIMQGFGNLIAESLSASRTVGYFNLDVGAERRTRVILRFDNGAPALLEARRAGGRVLLLTTSIDVDYTDLPLRSAYPALLQRTVRYLANAVEGGARGLVREGEPVDVPVPTGSDALALTSPVKERKSVELAGGTRAHFGALSPAGLFLAEVRRGDTWTREPRLDVAVSPGLAESDFAVVTPAQVAAALGGDKATHGIDVALGGRGEADFFGARGYASYLLLALCLCFIGESLLAARG